MKKILVLFILLTLPSACAPTAPALTPTPTLTPTATTLPTPTPDPLGDPDGDGYQTSFEKLWGSDPMVFTSFENLQQLNSVISGIAHIKEPYDLNAMNMTAYQQVRLIRESIVEENNNSWNTISFEFVLFPYVTRKIAEYSYNLEYPYDTSIVSVEYLESHLATDTCSLEEKMMAPIIASSSTLGELISKVSSWNHENLENDIYKLINLHQKETGGIDNFETLSKISSCFMMKNGVIGLSTNVANKSASDFREAGIPSGIIFSFDPTDVGLETKEHLDDWRCTFLHPQTAIWIPKYGWIVYDHNGLIEGARQSPFYSPLLITNILPDFSSMNLHPWVSYSDWIDSKTSNRPSWLFYSENILAPNRLLNDVKPMVSNPCGE